MTRDPLSLTVRGMGTTDLTPDELLTTTRSVRRRLDLAKPVPTDLLRACVEIALQAPTGGNSQGVHFVIVTDEAKRATIADMYRRSWAGYRKAPGSVYDRYAKTPDGPRKEQMRRVVVANPFKDRIFTLRPAE